MSTASRTIERLESRTLLAAGDLVGTFGNNGVVYHDAIDSNLLAVQRDGGILAVSGSRVLRFNGAGAPDTSFGVNGIADAGFDIAGMELLPDERIVVGGVKGGQWAAARFTAAGAPDASFGNGGVALAAVGPAGVRSARDLALQPDGKILVLAEWSSLDPDDRYTVPVVVRFNADGTVDTTFDGDGEMGDTTRDADYNYVNTLTVRPDGAIVIGGRWTTGGLSHNPSYWIYNRPPGVPAGADYGFTEELPDYAEYVDSVTRSDGTVALAIGGKAYAVGAMIVNLDEQRLQLDFEPEWNTFYNQENVRAIAAAADNKVIVAGEASPSWLEPEQPSGDEGLDEPTLIALQRLNPDGTLDASFGDGGTRLVNLGEYAREVITAVEVAPNGDVVALGWVRKAGQPEADRDYFIARFDGTDAPAKTAPGNRAGDLDARFGERGVVVHDTLNPTGTTAVQSDGKVLVAQGTALVRLTTGGAIDTTFGNGGRLDVGLAIDHLVIDPVGRIVVAGPSNQQDFVARFNADGTPDGSFGVGGRVAAPAELLAVQPDSKIVLANEEWDEEAEQSRGVITRLNADGSPDTQFGTGGRAERPASSFSDEIRVLLARPDGSIVVAGQTLAGGHSHYGWYEAYDATGKPIANPDFGGTPDGVLAGYKDGAVRPDGGVVFVQKPSDFAVRDRVTLAGGGAVVDFVPAQSGGDYTESPNDLAADYRDRVLVGGAAGPEGGPILAGLQRLNPDGTPDGAFGPSGARTFSVGYDNQSVLAVETLPNGDILVIGSAQMDGEAAKLFVARVNGFARRVVRPPVRTAYVPPRRAPIPIQPPAQAASAATVVSATTTTRRAAPVRPTAASVSFGVTKIRRAVAVRSDSGPRELLR
jgi:uncharacterized delta-60 repeat protein